MSLSGRSVIVTGAGSGIGRSIAATAAGQGARVSLVGRREAQLKQAATEIEGETHVVVADVAGHDFAGEVVDSVVERFGEIDVVVNNAGQARFGRLDAVDLAEFSSMLAVNVVGPAGLIRAALPFLRRGQGAVVNVSSVAGVLSMPGRSFYGASKAAINSLTRSLARELAPEIRVNAVLPGPVDTPLWTTLGLTEAQTEALRDGLIADTPMNRFGGADEVARWVCALADPEFSGWITGALIPVDGGRTS